MKKHKKIIVAIISALVIMTGGYTVMRIHSEQEKAEMIKIAKSHQEKMDEEVRYGDKDHHIKTITYEWDTVKHNPMGGFSLQGYVNGDKDLDFGIAFDSNNGGENINCHEYRESANLGKFIGDYYD